MDTFESLFRLNKGILTKINQTFEIVFQEPEKRKSQTRLCPGSPTHSAVFVEHMTFMKHVKTVVQHGGVSFTLARLKPEQQEERQCKLGVFPVARAPTQVTQGYSSGIIEVVPIY